MRRGCRFLLLSVFLTVPLISLEATSFRSTTPEQKIKESDLVCAAKYSSQKTKLTRSKVVITVAKFNKIKCFKGDLPDTFEVTWPGGTYRDTENGKIRKTSVIGTPQFQKAKEPVILHLTQRNPNDPYLIHSWSRGIIPLHWDKSQKDYVLDRPQTIREFRRPNEIGTRQSTRFQRQDASPETLSHFGETVRQVLDDE